MAPDHEEYDEESSASSSSSNGKEEEPLLLKKESSSAPSSRQLPLAIDIEPSSSTLDNDDHNPKAFDQQAVQLAICFCGLQASYLTWGYMQELIMTSQFNPTDRVPDGKFPSAAFCVFSNRVLAVVVAMVAVRIRHGAMFANNTAPWYAFLPCAISNTMSSWSQYAALSYISFPEQTVFKSSKIIAVMLMGKALQGKSYPWGHYVEACLITCGICIFSYVSKTSKSHDFDSNENDEESDDSFSAMTAEAAAEKEWSIGISLLCMYIVFDSFTSQYQDRLYTQYGRANVDPFQMMLGVNTCAIVLTTTGLLWTGDFAIVWEFLLANYPSAIKYNVLTAISSASGQIFIFTTIQQFGPIVFTIMGTIRQMLSICLSAAMFGHVIPPSAIGGAALVFGVIFWQIRRKYYEKRQQQQQQQQQEPSSNNDNNLGTKQGTITSTARPES